MPSCSAVSRGSAPSRPRPFAVESNGRARDRQYQTKRKVSRRPSGQAFATWASRRSRLCVQPASIPSRYGAARAVDLTTRAQRERRLAALLGEGCDVQHRRLQRPDDRAEAGPLACPPDRDSPELSGSPSSHASAVPAVRAPTPAPLPPGHVSRLRRCSIASRVSSTRMRTSSPAGIGRAREPAWPDHAANRSAEPVLALAWRSGAVSLA